MAYRASLITILVLASLSLLVSTIPEGLAPGVEVYTFTPVPLRVQESNTPGVDLVLNVTNAAVGSTYSFTWTVTDPSGSAKNHSNQTVTSSSSFLISLVYPRDFGTNINYVGNYTVRIDQSQPSNKLSVATGRFTVGLTDLTSYQRTYTGSVKARGYGNNSPVNINISHNGTSAPSYPATILADGTGQVSTSWTIPANASTGLWIVSLTGNPVKTVRDSQTFAVYPTNVTVSQLTLSQTVLQKTQTQSFTFTASYLSGLSASTGGAPIRITEPDGATSFYTTAYYNATLSAYHAAYQIPLSGQSGAWVASIDPDVFNDSYRNGGPPAGIVRGFSVQPATLAVTVTVSRETYTVGSVVPVYAGVTTPDGSLFTNGTVNAVLSFNGTNVGSPLRLTFVSGQKEWVGAYTVKSTDPNGLWLVTVTASDKYENSGWGTSSAVVSVPPYAPPPSQPSGLNTSSFVLLAAIAAAGALAALFWAVLVARRKTSRREVKLDLRVVDKEADRIQDTEFFQNVKKQVEDQKTSQTGPPPPEAGENKPPLAATTLTYPSQNGVYTPG